MSSYGRPSGGVLGTLLDLRVEGERQAERALVAATEGRRAAEAEEGRLAAALAEAGAAIAAARLDAGGHRRWLACGRGAGAAAVRGAPRGASGDRGGGARRPPGERAGAGDRGGRGGARRAPAGPAAARGGREGNRAAPGDRAPTSGAPRRSRRGRSGAWRARRSAAVAVSVASLAGRYDSGVVIDASDEGRDDPAAGESCRIAGAGARSRQARQLP